MTLAGVGSSIPSILAKFKIDMLRHRVVGFIATLGVLCVVLMTRSRKDYRTCPERTKQPDRKQRYLVGRLCFLELVPSPVGGKSVSPVPMHVHILPERPDHDVIGAVKCWILYVDVPERDSGEERDYKADGARRQETGDATAQRHLNA